MVKRTLLQATMALMLLVMAYLGLGLVAVARLSALNKVLHMPLSVFLAQALELT